MPRIPNELLERIKAEVAIERLVERSGVELKRHGENLLGRCLWHDDKTASLVVTPSRGLWHCMGACQTGGSVIDWVMRIDGVSFRAAVEVILTEFFPMEARSVVSPSPKRSTVPQLPSPIDPDAGDEETADAVAFYYHERLKETPDALAYLEKRGLRNAETIEHFRLGFSDRTLGLRLPLINRKAGSAIRTRLQRLGVYRPNGREHFRGCLTIPFFDAAGHVVGMYGRRIEQHLSADAPKHLYSAGPHRGLLNPCALASSKEIVLCEAPIDALTFFRWGFKNVTTSYGAEGFTDELFEAFVACAIERVFIAYDRDDAGDVGARKTAEKLMKVGIECFRVLFPKGMDANDYALKVQPGDKSLGVLLRAAEWMGSGERAARARSTGELVRAAREPEATKSASPPLPADDETEGAAKKEKLGESAPKTSAKALDPSPTFRFAQAETASASTSPASATATPPLELGADDEAFFSFEDRSYRVRGLKKALQSGSLHVTVRAQREGDLFAPPSPIAGWFLDRFDFVSSRQRSLFEKQVAQELGVKPEVIKWDLGQVLRRLEELQHQALEAALRPKAVAPVMSGEARAEALEMLTAEDLVERILADFEKCGVVGESTNKLVGYLAALSRKLERPLAVIVRSSSAAGKTALMDAILSFVPPDEREKYSALSENSLFYFEGKDFKHKVLAIVEEEGAAKASYALKLLQSEGEITVASTGKDPGTGRLVTKEYRVEGPVMIFLTSTAPEIDDELLNRAVVLTVDEGREQTRAVHRLQREAETLEGILAREERAEVLARHHNAQRLIRPLEVVNPYAPALTFMDDRTRSRRDHTKYLALIRAIALLFQYQRPVKTRTTKRGRLVEYVEVTLSDVALANRLAGEVLGRSLDELPPQTRRLVVLVDDMVKEASTRLGVDAADFRFSRRDVRERTGWGDTQLKVHLARLVDLEYLLVHRGGRGQSFVYELLYHGEGKDGSRFLPGLIDVEALAEKSGDALEREEAHTYDAERSGSEAERSGVGRPAVGPWPVGGRGDVMVLQAAGGAAFGAVVPHELEVVGIGSDSKTYAQPPRTHEGNGDASHRQLLMRRVRSGF